MSTNRARKERISSAIGMIGVLIMGFSLFWLNAGISGHGGEWVYGPAIVTGCVLFPAGVFCAYVFMFCEEDL